MAKELQERRETHDFYRKYRRRYCFGASEIINAGTLILQDYQRDYPFDKIVAGVKPDFIILTNRYKRRGFQDHPQTILFKELLSKEFSRPVHVSDGRHSDLWIYKRIRHAPANKESELRK